MAWASKQPFCRTIVLILNQLRLGQAVSGQQLAHRIPEHMRILPAAELSTRKSGLFLARVNLNQDADVVCQYLAQSFVDLPHITLAA